MTHPTLPRRLAVETLGTAALLATVVGSGIMGEKLAGGIPALALLANSIATGAGLYVLITLFAPISGAHFNPVVSGVQWARGVMSAREALLFMGAQFMGGVAGVLAAHGMFELPLWQTSTQVRSGMAQWFSEALATFGLLLVILQVGRRHPERIAAMVASYIVAAYWFTASTSFANPAVTLARALTDTFSGIHPGDVAGFVIAQIVGGALALGLSTWLDGDRKKSPQG